MPTKPSLSELCLYFLKLGTVGFGGPAVLVAAMQRDLVEARGWYRKEEYTEGLAFAQLAPGPLAAQLAMYLGWLRVGVLGATLVAAAFILPSFIMILAISAAYVRYGGLAWIQAAFYGIGAAIIAVIANSVYKLLKKLLVHDRLLWTVAGISAVVTAVTERELAWLFVLSGFGVMLVRQPKKAPVLGFAPWLLTGTGGLASVGLLWKLAAFFVTAGAFVFGSGLAIVPFLHGGVVVDNHWLTERQFLDAVAVAMITPGPVVITVGFIGYLVAGPVGACIAAVCVFLPSYLVVILAARHYRRLAKNVLVVSFVGGVTAAAAGAICGAVVVMGRKAIFDLPTFLVALGALFILLKFRKIPEPVILIVAGIIGVLLRGSL